MRWDQDMKASFPQRMAQFKCKAERRHPDANACEEAHLPFRADGPADAVGLGLAAVLKADDAPDERCVVAAPEDLRRGACRA